MNEYECSEDEEDYYLGGKCWYDPKRKRNGIIRTRKYKENKMTTRMGYPGTIFRC